MKVTVRTLAGATVAVECAADAVISDLRDLLGPLGSAKLMYKGEVLADHRVLGTLGVMPGTFLTAVELRREPKPRRSRAPPGSPPPAAEQPFTPRSPGALDTLLPGYAARPHPSPRAAPRSDRKRKQPGAGALDEVHLPAPTPALQLAPSDAAAADALPAAAVSSLPLPPALRRLERAFLSLAAAHAFLCHARMQATWAAVAAALAGVLAEPLALADVRALARLCPAVVAVRRAARGPRALEPWRGPRAADAAAALAAAGALEAAAARHGGAIPHPAQVLTDGAGTVLLGNGDDDGALIVEVCDPGKGRVPGPLPPAFIEAVRRGEAAAAPAPAAGSEAAAAPAPPAAEEAGRARPGRMNPMVRAAWEVRRTLVAALAALQSAALAAAGEPPSGRGGWRATRSAPSAGASAGAGAGADAAALLAAGEWHPRFDLAAHSVDAVLAAADFVRAQLAPTAAAGAPAAGAEAGAAAPGPPSVDDFLALLRSRPWYRGQAVAAQRVPARPARHAASAASLPPAVERALRARGVGALFSHQAAAVDALRRGAHTVVCTSTASGKSLCYLLPILEALAAEPSSTRALLIFPTKACAWDQLRAARALVAAAFGGGAGAPAVAVLDGDTPRGAERDAARDAAQIILTNPDMLHAAILPAHRSYARLLGGLRYIVVDEAHMYTGAFGAHTALVLRRLRRLAERVHRAVPVFCCTSATVANAGEFCARLLGVPAVHVVDEDGSPSAAKTFVLWNTPLLQLAPGAGGEGPVRAAQEARREATRQARQDRRAGFLPAPKAATGDAALEASRELAAARVRRRRAATAEALGVQRPPAALAAAEPAAESPRAGPPAAASWRERAAAAAAAAHHRAAKRRESPIVETARLLAECVRVGLRTIAFCRSRRLVELVVSYCHDELAATGGAALAARVAAYRSGYSADDRRALEAALGSGALLGVAATNALELGIDVGGLDVTLHLGCPASAASFRQQAGRAGRRERASLAVLVAFDSPLDQWFCAHPAALLGRAVEAAVVDPLSRLALEAHLCCAAAEAPLLLPPPGGAPGGGGGDGEYFGADARLGEAVAALLARRELGRRAGAPPGELHYTGCAPPGGGGPAAAVSLRAIDAERFAVVDESRGAGAVIEEVEASRAFFSLYDGAVYLHQGRTFLVKKVDLDRRVAIVRPADLKYYTRVADMKTVAVAGGEVAFEAAALGGGGGAGGAGATAAAAAAAGARCGQATVATRFLGFARVWKGSGAVFDVVDLHLPDSVYETEAAYVRLPRAARAAVAAARRDFRGGVHAAAHALLAVLPLRLAAGAGDAACECDSPFDTRHKPERLLIYDRCAGGVGVARAARGVFGDLLRLALGLVEGCGCDGDRGCPGCVMSAACSEFNEVLDKPAAAIVLREALRAAGLEAAPLPAAA